jgi:hypothetical protein
MDRNTDRDRGVPGRKAGGESDEHWLESIEQGRRGLDPEDVEEVHELDEEGDLFEEEAEEFEDETEDDEDLRR